MSRYGRVRRKLEEWDGAGSHPSATGQSSGLRRWLPAAIVSVSLGAAAMGWQASVADERATHKDELSRQALVSQQQIELQKIQAVDSQLRVFGEFERYSLLAHALQHEARLAGSQRRDILTREATSDLRVAGSLTPQLPLAAEVRFGKGYDVRTALTYLRSSDRRLSSLEPNRLRFAARSQRDRGLHLVGLAVLFIVALVFFTFAAVTSRRRTVNRRQLALFRPTVLAGAMDGPGAVTYWFAAAGAAVAAASLVLFAIVRW
jgi:hypothetical protein